MDRYVQYQTSGIRVRYGLGYGQPNSTHYTLFVIVALLIVAYRNKLKWYHYIFVILYNSYIFSYTNSKTGFFMCSMLCVLSYLSVGRKGVFLQKLLALVADKSYYFGAIISLIICISFSYVPFLSGYGTLTSRFNTATRVFKNNYITLFGIKNITTDFGYINILYGNGIIVFVLFIICLSKLTKLFIKKNEWHIVIVFICYAVYTLSEAYSSSVLMNVSLLFLGYLIFSHDIFIDKDAKDVK